ncbi:hypothetical protein Pmani_019225 [Petrolisthes manimaculis]|uniref:Uncharacterized protein n=1 Tax=Petrolisthes manimaculis TaxID=1843537 RepID=A0AAE1PI47_9EUCA|nr:hypothetical protein Pmani_019225 [Petrolisthes manimaculis]
MIKVGVVVVVAVVEQQRHRDCTYGRGNITSQRKSLLGKGKLYGRRDITSDRKSLLGIGKLYGRVKHYMASLFSVKASCTDRETSHQIASLFSV